MKILVVSPLASHQPTGGAKRRIYNLLWHLKRAGHSIHFVYTCHEDGYHEGAAAAMAQDWDSVHVVPFTGKYTRSLGEDFGLDDWIEPGSGEQIAQLCAEIQPDIALIQYVFQSYYCDFIPEGVPTIIDAHDKLSRRELFEKAGMTPGFFYTTEDDELRGLTRADLILAIQDGEAAYFSRSGSPVVVVGHIAEPSFVDRRFDSLSKIGVMAAFNKFNVSALEATLPAILSRLDELDAEVEFHVAGNVVEGFDIEHRKLIKRGFVHDQGAFYREMDLIVNPTLQGTGLKIKTVEAMAFGMPLVSTNVGFDGLSACSPLHQAEDAAELADAIEDVYRNQFGALTKLSNISRATFSEYAYNLKRNIAAVFSPALIEAVRQGKSVDDALSGRVSKLGDVNDPAFKKLRDIRVSKRPYKLGHMVNPVDLGPGSDLYIAQPVTFESMRRAKAFADGRVDVDLMATAYPEDTGAMPADGFTHLPALERSVLDEKPFAIPRKLPLLADLLTRAAEGTDADYLIYTNVDIALTPQFYVRVAEMIDQGHDAIIINRRTISKSHSRTDAMAAMYAEYGADHPGYDCFVFRRDLLDQFNLGKICVGVHLIGRVLLWNLRTFARNLHLETSEHLTFHIGDDVPSKDARLMDYIRHNVGEAVEVLRDLQNRAGLLTDLELSRERKLLTLNFGPTMFKVFEGGKVRPALARTIMIHAMFRSGSTYLWRKLRELPQLKAYYEPLHEDLALMNQASLPMLRQRHKASTFHKLSVDNWLFSEFEGLLAGEKGSFLPGFDRRFSYDDFAEPSDSDGLKSYIDSLLEGAGDATPLLQFNRSSLRQGWFQSHYPDAFHIYMQRSARGQWGSYASFVNRGRMGFLRNTIMLAGKNADQPKFAPLARLIPLAATDNTANMHQLYDGAYGAYSIEELYTAFYFIWIMSTLEGAEHADLFLDVERLSLDRIYQLDVEFQLMCCNAPLDLSDARIPGYDPKTLGIPEDRLQVLEDRVHSAIVEAGIELPLDRLRTLGQDQLADRLSKAGKLTDAPDPDVLAARRADIEAELRADEERVANQTWQPLDHEPAPDFAPRALAIPQGGGEIGLNTMYAIGGTSALHLLRAGWHEPDSSHVWSAAPSSSFALNMGVCENTVLELGVKASARKRSSAMLKVRFDGTEIFSGKISGEFSVISCPIPGELTQSSGRHIVELVCALEKQSGAGRGVCLRSIEVVRPVSPRPVEAEAEAADTPPTITDSQRLSSLFPVGERTLPGLVAGWSHPESVGVWATGLSATFEFALDKDTEPDSIYLQLRTLDELSDDSTMFWIELNGETIYLGPLFEETHLFRIAQLSALLRTDGLNHLQFGTRRAVQPPGDDRQISLMLTSVSTSASPPEEWAERAAATGGPYPVSIWGPVAAENVSDVPAQPEMAAPTVRMLEANETGDPNHPGLIFQDGWSYPEGEHIWAEQTTARLLVELSPEEGAPNVLVLNVMLPEGRQDEITVRLNDAELGMMEPGSQFDEYELDIDLDLIDGASMVEVELELQSDQELIIDPGGRSLAFCFKSICFQSQTNSDHTVATERLPV